MQKQTKKIWNQKNAQSSAWSPLISELGERDNVDNDGVDCNDDN